MTDNEHAEAINSAVRELNNAIKAAGRTGLRIEISVLDDVTSVELPQGRTQWLNANMGPIVGASVMRPLLPRGDDSVSSLSTYTTVSNLPCGELAEAMNYESASIFNDVTTAGYSPEGDAGIMVPASIDTNIANPSPQEVLRKFSKADNTIVVFRSDFDGIVPQWCYNVPIQSSESRFRVQSPDSEFRVPIQSSESRGSR